MESANLFLENTLLLLATLLFLAILPRALSHILSQKEKTALDKVVERFEEEELKAAESESKGNDTKHEKPVALKDGSLAYLTKSASTPSSTEDYGGIPPFPSQEEEEEEKRVKIVKPGIPISHYETMTPPPRKKVKLIKQEFSIAPDKNKASAKKESPDPIKENQSKSPVKEQKSVSDEAISMPPAKEIEEPDNNWIEAEIPGLTIEPPKVEEAPESIPTFKAAPKTKHQPEVEESPQKEKQDLEVKNIASKSEEKKDSKPEKQTEITMDSVELKMEISESEPKAVEINAPVVSHRKIDPKEAERQEIEAPSSKVEETQETQPEITATPSQQEDINTSAEKEKPKPFLLDLKYLDQEETESLVSHEGLSADMVDAMIARLNALQVDLENQLVSVPDELTNENMRTDRIQDSPPDLEGTTNELSDKKDVSLEELDLFLFTSTQRKK